MFDLGKLGDMAKIAGQAKEMQDRQECFQREQLDLLKKISKQMDDVITILKKRT